jgi:stalled ribosome alternative rescue factor ArfA
MMTDKNKKFQYDGRSRPADDKYKENYDRIFKTNPVAKEVRTSKYKLQVVKVKKGKGSYDRNHHDDG